ncbi:hypothetical protein, partial [Mesorhizobium sp. GR13]|uniref:hypothetical protein n=1 Tax=Mesorhizobium sp. GR13 TaxID=2562308 RepID=UPI001982384B
MASKALFAAFVFDEAPYAQGSGSLDHHVLDRDRSQSSFADHPGISSPAARPGSRPGPSPNPTPACMLPAPRGNARTSARSGGCSGDP